METPFLKMIQATKHSRRIVRESRPWGRGLLAGALLASNLLTGGCSNREPPRKMAFPAMGTIVEITLPSHGNPDLDMAVGLARREVESVENALSAFRESSELSRVNREAYRTPQPLEGHLRTVCRFAMKVADWSEGAFDPTIGPLLDCWGFRQSEAGEAPDEATLATVSEGVGWTNITLRADAVGQWFISFKHAGMELDFGGIAKGYAVDRIDQAFQAAGMKNYMIDAGGNILCRGSPSRDGRPWRIGVRNPFSGRNDTIASIELTDGMAVATSGNYERFRVYDGKRYAHILDPGSGRPVRGMAAVTVRAASAIEADALSTALFVLGIERGLAKLHTSDFNAGVLFIPDKRPVEGVVDSRMHHWLHPFAPFEIKKAGARDDQKPMTKIQ